MTDERDIIVGMIAYALLACAAIVGHAWVSGTF
jgi:hypothetical protein